jgi:hypothetical protein
MTSFVQKDWFPREILEDDEQMTKGSKGKRKAPRLRIAPGGQECDGCDGVGQFESGETCLMCRGSGRRTR